MDRNDRIRRSRERREEFFGEDEDSPLSAAEQEEFAGFEHYEIDEDYRFQVPMDEHDDYEEITITTTGGSEDVYYCVGEFTVIIDGEAVTLQAYTEDPEDDELWVPFRDGTSGQETYGAGRFIDLRARTHKQDDDTWVLDFNEAYNPVCAYSDGYECPLPPAENWLAVPIEAGEKSPPGK